MRKVFGIYALLIALNAGAWAVAFWAFWSHSILLGTAVLAYTFGLRHAVDADHISAIDNVTRKLMQEGKRPVSVGFYFSLGHSTVVVALSLPVAIATTLVKGHLPVLERAGELIGTAISAGFLVLVAAINIVVLVDIAAALGKSRREPTYEDRRLDAMLEQRGVMGRFFRPLMRVVDCSWKMYPIGVLFGLGFDTASEVALLGIAAVEAGKSLPIFFILLFPLLFAAGMSLLDTTDGILMLGAYGWAFVKPVRKLYYNMAITLVSVCVALVIGGIEIAGILAHRLAQSGGVWDAIRGAHENFGMLGFIIVGIFAGSWILSAAVYKLLGYDKLTAA